MGDQATMPAPEGFGEGARNDGRGGGRQDRVRRRVVDEAVRRKLIEPFGDQRPRLVGYAGAGIVERDVAAAAREHDGPGATDEAGSDDGDAPPHIHNVFLLSTRSSLSICEAPVQVTVPRSSTTVRSDSASARSR